jgi:hypothetical protein
MANTYTDLKLLMAARDWYWAVDRERPLRAIL